jgi:hypothetical protein
LAFRFEITGPDGRPVVVFEERENLDLGSWELVTTYRDPSLPAERCDEFERQAVAEWIRHDPPAVNLAGSWPALDITEAQLRHPSAGRSPTR